MFAFMGWLCYHNVRYDVMKCNQSHKKPVGDVVTFQGHCVVPTQRVSYGVGNPAPLWSRYKKQNKYWFIKTPDGWIQEHRFIMQQFIGRQLKGNEVVHHIDENINNNNINNLLLMTHAEHTKYHHVGLKRSASTRNRISKACKLKDYFRHPSYKDILPSDIIDAIRNCQTITKAAESLGVTRRTLYNKISKFCLKKKGEMNEL